MSIQATFLISLANPITQVLTDGNVTLIDEANGAGSNNTLVGWSFQNNTGGAVICELYRYEDATTTQFLEWVGSVGDDVTTIVTDKPLRLREGDEIRAKGANGIVVTLTYGFIFAQDR